MRWSSLGLFFVPLVLATAGRAEAPVVRAQASDFPPGALERGAKGEVTVKFVISGEGRVQDCTIAKSSKDASLDEASCDMLVKRGTFEPSLPSSAKLRTATMIVSWVVPKDIQKSLAYFGGASPISPRDWVDDNDLPPGLVPYGSGTMSYVSFDINTSGRVENCHATEPTNSGELSELTCHVLSKRARFLPAYDGTKVKRTSGQCSVRWVQTTG